MTDERSSDEQPGAVAAGDPVEDLCAVERLANLEALCWARHGPSRGIGTLVDDLVRRWMAVLA